MLRSFSPLRRRGLWGRVAPLLLVLTLLVGGCKDGELLPPAPEAGDLFARYVAIGNSITAGWQAGGINASLQQVAYPNLLATQMGTPFNLPLLNAPGCPPPLTQIFPEPQRTGGDQAPACALRDADTPEVLNNVAVPEAEVVDVLSNTDADANPNALTTFILGGRTQIEAAREADPTFVSAWIGNNDVLGAALVGEPSLATSESEFTSRYTQMLDGLDQLPDLEGAALFSVVDVTQIPNLSAGAAYAAAIPQARAAGLVPSNFNLNACATSTALVPFQYGATLIGVAAALVDQGTPLPVTLDCSQDLTVEDAVENTFAGVPGGVPPEISAVIEDVATVSLLQNDEISALRQRIQIFNAFISTQADDRGYAFVDVNTVLDQRSQQIPPFPDLTSNQPFGPVFSLDGVHPSSAAHEAVADAAIEAINGRYESANIPPLSP
jgi:lysophospholipase L1-like esterase